MISNFFKLFILIRNQKIYEIKSFEEIKSITSKIDLEIKKVDFNNVYQATDFRQQKMVFIFENFLEKGDIGVFAFVNGKVVGHAWAVLNADQPSKRIDGYMDINRDECFIHYCNVSEEYRGKNIYPQMLSWLCKELVLVKKMKKIIIDCDISNVASLRGIEKIGFVFKTQKLFIRVFKKIVLKL